VSLVPTNVDMRRVLQTLNLNESDPKTQALLLVCDKYHLDPLLKHVQIIQGSTYITRDGYLAIAHASGQFDGMETVEDEETDNAFIVKVSVYRKDMKHPFTAKGRSEKKRTNNGPDPADMALARAERRALRRAFNVAGVGTGDIDNDDVVDVIEPAEPAAIVSGLNDDDYDQNRVAALAALNGIGIRSEEARHTAVELATNGATQSTKRLTDDQVDAIRDWCKWRQSQRPYTDPETNHAGETGITPVDDLPEAPNSSTRAQLSAVNNPAPKKPRANAAEPIRPTGLKPRPVALSADTGPRTEERGSRLSVSEEESDPDASTGSVSEDSSADLFAGRERSGRVQPDEGAEAKSQANDTPAPSDSYKGETAEIADDFTIIALRNQIKKLPVEAHSEVIVEWHKRGLGSVKAGARNPLLMSQAQAAQDIVDAIEKEFAP
jgi:hypothetical protein